MDRPEAVLALLNVIYNALRGNDRSICTTTESYVLTLTLVVSQGFGYDKRKLFPNNMITTHAFPSLEASSFQSNRSPSIQYGVISNVTSFRVGSILFPNSWAIKLYSEYTRNTSLCIPSGAIFYPL